MAGSAAAAATAAAPPFSVLHPAGETADGPLFLWWLLLAVSLLTFVAVLAVLGLALRQRRPATRLSDRAMLVGGGLVFPIVVLSGLLAAGLIVGERLLVPDRRGQPDIHVVADLDGWTMLHRTGDGRLVETRNLLLLPAGHRVLVQVESRDVIHSFWVPRIAGKIDAIPGRQNRIELHVREPGAYRGQCAEFCGVNHAHMQFQLVAVTPRQLPQALIDAGGRVVGPDEAVFSPREPPAAQTLRTIAGNLLRWLGLVQ